MLNGTRNQQTTDYLRLRKRIDLFLRWLHTDKQGPKCSDRELIFRNLFIDLAMDFKGNYNGLS